MHINKNINSTILPNIPSLKVLLLNPPFFHTLKEPILMSKATNI